MTDHIIKAAKAAGGTTYTNRHHNGTACAFGPDALERFYAIAYRQALEDAVSACDETMAPINIGSIKLANAFYDGTHACIDAIRALKEQPNG